ncbi:MAG: SufD family Fe-S cluster assembly protein [Alphaproteobacteria bacterium]|jgi:Fe-S cluster assembly protein SufD|nr:SufD family Fe-S cluster assembly protein [Alphaproteobacteria bacterium]
MLNVTENTEHRIIDAHSEDVIVVKRNARLYLYLLDSEDDVCLKVKQEENSYFETFFINKANSIDISVNMESENCEANIAGVYSLKDKQEANININVFHDKPKCSSSINIRGIAKDKSRANLLMKSLVAEGAVKTEAKQLHRAMVLSDDAKIMAKPELEIYNDDVQCAHGNTVGNLDKTAVFYLQSRGIPESLAREMLIDGFLDEAVKFVSDNSIKEKIFDLINENKND